MAGNLLVLLYLVAASFIVCLLTKRRIGHAIPFVIFTTILISYFADLIGGDLRTGLAACWLLAAAGAMLVFCRIRKGTLRLTGTRELVFTTGGILYLVLFCWIIVLNHGRMISQTDEFSHWGLVYKNMAIFNRFGNYQYSTDGFKGYPPAMALWQYFVLKMHSRYSDMYAFMGTGWLLCSVPAPIAEKFHRKQIAAAALYVLLLLLMPVIFFYNYMVILYVDAVLGILFGYLVWLVFHRERVDGFYYLNVGVTMAALCLVKASGVVFAMIGGLILVSLSVRERYISTKGTSPESAAHRDASSGQDGSGSGSVAAQPDKDARHDRKIAAALLTTVAAVTAGKLSWTWYLRITGTAPAWNTSSINAEQILRLLHHGGEEYQYTVISNFLHALCEADFSGFTFNMHFMNWLVVIGLAFLAVYILYDRRTRGGLKAVVPWLYIGALFYTAGMLLLYVFTYSEGEAVNLASFNRYMGTYLTGMLFTVLALCADLRAGSALRFNAKYLSAAVTGILLLFLNVMTLHQVTIDLPSYLAQSRFFQDACAGALSYLSEIDYKTEKMSVIAQHTDGQYSLGFSFTVTPIRTTGPYSLGKPYSENDIYTVDLDPQEWLRTLEKDSCHYVYLMKTDEQFDRGYSAVFETAPEQGRLYRILEENGQYRLRLME